MIGERPNEMRTPMRRVRGLGAAHAGTKDFWHQRVTSVAGIPLTIALIVIVILVCLMQCCKRKQPEHKGSRFDGVELNGGAGLPAGHKPLPLPDFEAGGMDVQIVMAPATPRSPTTPSSRGADTRDRNLKEKLVIS